MARKQPSTAGSVELSVSVLAEVQRRYECHDRIVRHLPRFTEEAAGPADRRVAERRPVTACRR